MGERKIPMGTGLLMIAIAFGIDLANVALDGISFGLLSWVVDAIEITFFSIWLSHYDASLWKQNPGLSITAAVVDAVPLGDLTFPWTWRVGYSVFHERTA